MRWKGGSPLGPFDVVKSMPPPWRSESCSKKNAHHVSFSTRKLGDRNAYNSHRWQTTRTAQAPRRFARAQQYRHGAMRTCIRGNARHAMFATSRTSGAGFRSFATRAGCTRLPRRGKLRGSTARTVLPPTDSATTPTHTAAAAIATRETDRRDMETPRLSPAGACRRVPPSSCCTISVALREMTPQPAPNNTG